MIQFGVLGSLDLRGPEGDEILPVLSRPKHTAVLAYLAIASPRGFHRRDKIVALFWPEHDHEHARASLRGTVHYLRKSLGEEVVLSRGDEEIGLDWGQITCDAVEFQRAVEEGDLAGALDLYRGGLLEGFFLSGCPGFEQWLDEERVRLRELAAVTGWAMAHLHLRAGRITSAERTGQRALGLVATDENEVRRFIRALAEAGDRAAAVRFYERFAQILQGTLELEPSAETRALVQDIRSPEPLPEGVQPAVRGESDREPQERKEIAEEVKPSDAVTPTEGPWAARRHRSWVGMAGVAAVAVTALAVGYLLFSRGGDPGVELVENRVAVMPFENRTGREDLDSLGDIIADVILDGLSQIDVVEVVPSWVTSAFAREAGTDRLEIRSEGGVRTLADETRAATVVRGRYYLLGDSLIIQGEISDEQSQRIVESRQVTWPASHPMEAAGDLRKSVLTALALQVDPRAEEGLAVFFDTRLPPYDAYEAFMRSVTATFETDASGIPDARAILENALRAFELDSTFYGAAVAAGWGYYMAGQWRQADSLVALAESNSDEMSPGFRAWLTVLGARLHGNLEMEYGASQEMSRRFPSSWHLWQFGSAALTVNRPREAVEVLLRADPDSHPLRGRVGYWDSVVLAYHLLGRHEEELTAAREGRERFPDSPLALRNELMALAALGRVEEILAGVDTLISVSTGIPAPDLLLLAQELRTRGHPDEARSVLQCLLPWFQARAPSELESQTSRYYRGFIHYIMEEWDEAESLFTEIEREDVTGDRMADRRRLIDAPAVLGAIAARRGNREEATRRSQDLAAVDLPYMNGFNTLWRARIAAFLGDREEAMSLLQEAHAQGQPFGWDLLRGPLLETLRDYPPFQEFVRPKG